MVQVQLASEEVTKIPVHSGESGAKGARVGEDCTADRDAHSSGGTDSQCYSLWVNPDCLDFLMCGNDEGGDAVTTLPHFVVQVSNFQGKRTLEEHRSKKLTCPGNRLRMAANSVRNGSLAVLEAAIRCQG